jgi:colanic acid biosynthesis protein WcaH
MTESDRPIPTEEYETIVRHVPIVSVDLLVHHDGGLVLGKRRNAPAKGKWFVPGGTVLKGDTRRQAVHRVAKEELGSDVIIDGELGTYDHFYDTAEVDGSDSKQYLATAYIVTPIQDEISPDDQHTDLKVFDSPFPEFHNYIERYIQDLRRSGYQY